MKKFSKSFQANQTKVQVVGFDKQWFTIKNIHRTRQWVEVSGLCGSFQRHHITAYTNKTNK